MPLITCNVAKGVAPRVHKPKAKAQPRAKQGDAKSKPKPKASHKHATTSDLESEEDRDHSSSDDAVVKPKKKKSKQQHVEESDSEGEMEVIDQDVGPSTKEIEQVDDITGEWGLGNEQEDISLNDHQCGAELEELPVKKDLTLDLLMIITNKVTVKFKVAVDKFETVSA